MGLLKFKMCHITLNSTVLQNFINWWKVIDTFSTLLILLLLLLRLLRRLLLLLLDSRERTGTHES